MVIRWSRPTWIHIPTPPSLTAQSLLYQRNPSIAFWQKSLLSKEPLAVHVLPVVSSATFCQPAASPGKVIRTISFKLNWHTIKYTFLVAVVIALFVSFICFFSSFLFFLITLDETNFVAIGKMSIALYTSNTAPSGSLNFSLYNLH